ncbi:hypothetical protein ACFL6C_01615 [Myxococcota bacterium]
MVVKLPKTPAQTVTIGVAVNDGQVPKEQAKSAKRISNGRVLLDTTSAVLSFETIEVLKGDPPRSKQIKLCTFDSDDFHHNLYVARTGIFESPVFQTYQRYGVSYFVANKSKDAIILFLMKNQHWHMRPDLGVVYAFPYRNAYDSPENRDKVKSHR